jgi:hypothetical protein
MKYVPDYFILSHVLPGSALIPVLSPILLLRKGKTRYKIMSFFTYLLGVLVSVPIGLASIAAVDALAFFPCYIFGIYI